MSAALQRAAAIVLLAWTALFASATAAAEPRLPDGTLAVPPLARVTDTTGTLSAGQRQALEQKLAAFESARGTQIAVVIVGSTQPEPISDFAQRIGDAWKIGRHDVGDGLLLVVAKDDRRVWIAVAKALEGAVPDNAAARVIREQITPRFRQGDFAGGIGAALDSIFRLIEGEGLPAPSGRSPQDAGPDGIELLLPFIMVGVLFAVMMRTLFGVPGALLAGVGTGVVSGWMLASIGLGMVAGIAALVIGLVARSGGGGGRVAGGRRGGGVVVLPGGFGGGGWSGGGGGGGWSSGGGGDFGGGGAGGSW